jgi:ribonucleotide reductase alpha subunit
MTMYSYEKAYENSLLYFRGNDLAARVFLDKYAMRDKSGKFAEVTPGDMHVRLAKEFARIDSEKYGFDYDERYELYLDAMRDFARIVPQGSPMAAIGNKHQLMSASNCVVVESPEDSMEGIIDTGKNLAQLMKRRCVAAGSKVVTSTGVLNIEDVKPGMMILSYDIEQDKQVFKKVLDKFESDVDPSDRIIVKYSNGSLLKTSKKHPVLKMLDSGFDYVDAGSLKENDINLRPSLSKINLGNKADDANHDMAWLIGAHMGDGSIDRIHPKYSPNERLRFRILGDNESVVANYCRIHNNLTGNNSNYHLSSRKDYKTNCWEFSSSVNGNVKLAKLMDNQIGKKTYSGFVPSFIQNSSDDLFLSFFAGLVDADGAIKGNGEAIVVSLCAFEILDYVSARLQQMGADIYTDVREDVRPNESTIYRISVKYDRKLWSLLAEKMAHDVKRDVLAKYNRAGDFSSKFLISQLELNEIIDAYDNLVSSKDCKIPNLLAANIYQLKKSKKRGLGKALINQLVDFRLLSQKKADNIKNRVFVKSVIKDEESSKYYDIEVEDTNNFYCGTLGLVVIHNCGVGVDISTLRPDGMDVNNAARTTSGAWSFADFYSYITRMVAQKGRRGALMVTLSIHHPDVEKFTTMKHDLTKVTGANVSVRLSDDFLKAVEEDAEYEQRWPVEGEPKVRKMVKARQVWDLIVTSATETAEPGLIMWDNMISNLPAHCYPEFKTISTNPCCFAKEREVMVMTNNGIKEIQDVTSSDLVWIDSERVWAKTSGYFDAGLAETYAVKLSNGEELVITNNHKLEKLTKNLRTDGERKVSYSRRLVKLEDLEVGDRIGLHQNEVLETGSNVGSYEDGLILGWFAGDGCLSYKSAGDDWPTMHLAFWDNEHDAAERVLLATRNYIQNDFQSYHDGHGNNVIRIVSSYLTRELSEKYETNLWKLRKGTSELPYNASLDFVKGYLASYFTADGTVTNSTTNSRYNIQLGSVNREALVQVRNLLNLFGIYSSIGLAKEACRTKIRGKYYNCHDLYRLTITSKENIARFAEHIGFLSSNKQSKLQEIVSNYKRPSRANDAYAKIVEIKPMGIKEVGCIEVDHFHSFTANGIISGNSEIALSAFDSCRLISINLTGYVRKAFEEGCYFDFKAFKSDVRLAMQMADNLVDLELELISKIQEVCTPGAEKDLWQKLYNAGEQGRRTGLGTHGLADALAQLCIKYDSNEALEFIEKLYKTFRNEAYSTSVELAKVRGSFPLFDYEKEKDCAYIKRLPKSIRDGMKEHGRRNISLLTQAPTGSVSMESKVGDFPRFNVSSGVEPVFRNLYTRRKKVNASDNNVRVDYVDKTGDSWQEFKVYHSNVENYLEKMQPESGELPDYFVTSDQIDWAKRVELQGIEQQFLDHSISSTINLPKGTKPEVVGELYLKAWKHGLKGVTVYVDGSRDGVLVTDTSPEVDSDGRPTNIVPSNSPKRPEELPADVLHATVKGVKWTILVGLLNGEPYEMFMGKADAFKIPNKVSQAKLVRVKSGNYNLLDQTNNVLVKDVIKTADNDESAWTTRMMSMALRHGVPIKYLVDQLSKDGSIVDVNNVLARLLRKYLKAKKASTEKCPQCGSANLKYEDGCSQCLDCSYSGCS